MKLNRANSLLGVMFGVSWFGTMMVVVGTNPQLGPCDVAFSDQCPTGFCMGTSRCLQVRQVFVYSRSNRSPFRITTSVEPS
jgi:hypothetical protein